MAIEFTDRQKKILNARNHNVLVSAAAGSGKTAVLVERIVRMISEGEHPMDIDRLLVVTFTRAAAAQMRERIAKAIAGRLEENPENRHLQRQETLLHHAQITTIDSFCSYLLRNHFSEIGLDPGFRLMDETQNVLMLKDVLQEFLEQQYAKKDPAFVRCVEYFCPERSDDALEELIEMLFRKASSQAFPKVWLQERKKDYDVQSIEELESCEWYRELLLAKVKQLPEMARSHKAMQRLAALPDGPFPYLDVLEREDDALFGQLEETSRRLTERLVEEKTAKGVREELLQIAGFSFEKLPPVRKAQENGINVQHKEAVSSLRTALKKRLEELRASVNEDPAQTVERMQMVQEPLATLVDLTIGYQDLLWSRKRDKNLIDFSDLEHLALELLVERREDGNIFLKKTAEGLRDYYDEILIDEYQDSNDVQELLLSALAGEKRCGFVSNREGRYARFMVGDVKQSIYRFRNAKPAIFQAKFDSYPFEDKETERIDLDQNFRSRKEVLDAANGICGKVMRREIGGVDYDETVSLKLGACYPESAGEGKEPATENPYQTELLLIDGKVPEDAEEEDEIAELSSARKEALAVAQKIHSLMGTLLVTDEETKKLRPVRYGDIVILLRSTSGRQDAFREIFEKEGIPLYLEYKGGYFAAEEVREVLQMLRVIDNPRQDIPLYGVLRGYYGGFSEDEIGQLRSIYTIHGIHGGDDADRKKVMLYDCVAAAAGRMEEEHLATLPLELKERCRNFLEELDFYRAQMATTPIHELVGKLVRETGYENYVRALPAGERRFANLHSLLVKAKEFEQGDYAGLFRFLRYIDQMRAFDVDYGEAGTLDENADVVRLTTIHKSKGLEYPVCFVSGLGARFAFSRDTRGQVIVDEDMGLGVNLVVPSLRSRITTLRQRAVADKIAGDSLGEELRVLYVAMTRAKEKLILTGYVRDADKALCSLQTELSAVDLPVQQLPVSVIRKASGYLPLILESMEALEAEGAQPIRLQQVTVSDLQLLALENQATQGMLLQTLQMTEKAVLSGKETGVPDPGILPEPALARQLQERFSWRYPYENLKGLFTKTTVTELKRAAMLEESEMRAPGEGAAEWYPDKSVLAKPRFACEIEENERQSGTLQGAERGTAIHRMCEKIDYDVWKEPGTVTAEQFTARVQALIEDGTLPAEYETMLRPGVFLPFLKSDLAQRMSDAQGRGLLRREQPFVIRIPANRVNEEFPNEENILIQGIMDAFFIEGEGVDRHIIVVDYKTDRVKDARELVERYQMQLAEYAEALWNLLQLPVTEKIIYSFCLNQEIRL